MPLCFHFIKRPNMCKDAAAGCKLFYVQVCSWVKLDFRLNCCLKHRFYR